MNNVIRNKLDDIDRVIKSITEYTTEDLEYLQQNMQKEIDKLERLLDEENQDGNSKSSREVSEQQNRTCQCNVCTYSILP